MASHVFPALLFEQRYEKRHRTACENRKDSDQSACSCSLISLCCLPRQSIIVRAVSLCQYSIINQTFIVFRKHVVIGQFSFLCFSLVVHLSQWTKSGLINWIGSDYAGRAKLQ